MKFDKRLNQNCIVTFYEDLEVDEPQINVGFYNADDKTVMCACCGGTFELNEIIIDNVYKFDCYFAEMILQDLDSR